MNPEPNLRAVKLIQRISLDGYSSIALTNLDIKTLFDPTRHLLLTESIWSEDFVIGEINTIIDDIGQSVETDGCWPTHPLDKESFIKQGPLRTLYAGASGVVLALQILERYGYSVNNMDEYLPTIYSSYLEDPDVSVTEQGLHLGEIGILMPLINAQPKNELLLERLGQCMEIIIDHPAYEITSGQTGMMHAALFLYRQTGQNRWRNLYVRGAESLIRNWKKGSDGLWLWQSDIFGRQRRYYGGCHGVAGNANILFQGVDLLEGDCMDMVIDRAATTLELAAVRESGMANWHVSSTPDPPKLLVQWCHGAAGIVTGLASTPRRISLKTDKLDDILRMAGELTWKAGPLAKGAGLCHGTSGNGYAFLYLYRRWGEAMWLDRARKFAVHAIEQCQQDRSQYGQGRYSLWTGDAGLAIYLHHCVYPHKAAIPGLDLF